MAAHCLGLAFRSSFVALRECDYHFADKHQTDRNVVCTGGLGKRAACWLQCRPCVHEKAEPAHGGGTLAWDHC